MNLIAKHLDHVNLKIKVYSFAAPVICAFTGQKISKGVLMKDLIKPTFTDQEYIKYPSKYASIETALLIEEVIKTEKGFNSLRNYSFFATENKLQLLKREEISSLLFNIPETPFQIGVTYSNKKHISFKAPINYDCFNYQIITDLGIVNFNKKQVLEYLDIIQSWYTIIPEKKETAAQPTYFTKDEIKGLSIPLQKKINEYGLQKYFQETQFLQKYRNTSLFNLIVHTLNKKI